MCELALSSVLLTAADAGRVVSRVEAFPEYPTLLV